MTKNITIKNPSEKMMEVFKSLQTKKEQQTDKLSTKEQCTFTIKV